MLEFSSAEIILLVISAFLCEYVDSTLGMGYGTTITPVLLIIGFSPIQTVPAVLFSELFAGILAGLLHHYEGNVNLKPKTTNLSIIMRKIRSLGYVKSFKKGIPLHLKVTLVLTFCSIFGTVTAVFIALNIPEFWLRIYIGSLALVMGIVTMICLNKKFIFSWKKISFLGLLASFNKGISGGGYGPVVTSGQILSGIEGKSAIGITSLSEGLTCLVGVIAYLFVPKNSVNLILAPYLLVGAILSIPLSVKSVKKISTKKLKISIAIITIIIGLFTIIKAFKRA